ncbi:hypothetical protein AB0E69_40535 [Kribbella sp. NPDC026611]|uniref:hypothetical protein n=1 Tax=Kribbella sp. NPDC026611 TaxID=3154911 RepID=UPI0033EFACA1
MSDKYREAAEWAEHEMELPKNSSTAVRGKAAADFGKDLIEHSRRGRPSIDPDKAPGERTRVRQVRLPGSMDDNLTAFAQAHNTNPSAVLREALQEYLETHRIAG